MSETKSNIKVVKAALDDGPNGSIILRGVIEPESLHLLRVASYQREILPGAKISQLAKAFEQGSVPDIELGMRGDTACEGEDGWILKDPVFIIDGLQRVSAAKFFMEKEGIPHLGVVIHFDTTEKSERERFRILNVDRTKLSVNVLLRNMEEESPVMRMYLQLSQSRSFVLGRRICWQQRMKREELITGNTFVKAAGRLHSHLGATRSNKYSDLIRGSDKVMERIGKNVMRDNIKSFFEVIDEAWGIKSVVYKEGAIYLRQSFLETLARVMSQHTNFWRDDRLVVEKSLVRKLAQFAIDDPHVVNLASSGGKSRDMLYMMMVEHINHGKRTKRLQPRVVDYPEGEEEE